MKIDRPTDSALPALASSSSRPAAGEARASDAPTQVDAPAAAQRATADEATVDAAHTDRVTLDDHAKVETAVAAARAATGQERAMRLVELEAKVKSGGYTPDASRIADRILEDAALEARMRSMLR